MSATEIVEQLKTLNKQERLQVIEVAARLLREEDDKLEARAARSHRIRQTALALKQDYEPGGDLAELADFCEEVLDDYD